MIDLGRYSFDILLAYGLSAVLILGLVSQTVVAARRTRKALEDRGE